MEYAQDWFDGYSVPNEMDKFTVERDGKEIEMYNLEVGDVEDAEFLIAAHLDTVKLKEGWEVSDPLSGEIKDGKLYGRGSADTKSNAAAAMVAVRNAYDELEDPNVALVLESDEEVGFEGANRFLSKYDSEDLNCQFTVMCEPKDLNIVTKHKGVYHNEIDIKRELDENHASLAQKVDEDGEVYQTSETAVQDAIPVLEKLEEAREYMEGLEPHEDLGPVTFTTSIVNGGEDINSIPQNVRIVTDSRIPPNHDAEELAAKVESMVEPELKEGDTIKTEPLEKPVDVDDDNQFVRLFEESAQEADADPELEGMEAYTELGLYHEALDIPGVVFGTSPGLGVAHATDEYVEVDSIPIVRQTFENMINKMN